MRECQRTYSGKRREQTAYGLWHEIVLIRSVRYAICYTLV
ncbi:MAG: hypothetical protein OJF50_002065 [Nitrospira sp.]|nr:hypothetical protein [Nitrospira sp.]